MKALGLALIAALAIGCSNSPTAPSLAAGMTDIAGDQDHKPSPGSQTHTIDLFFLANGLDGRRPVGMPVDVWSATVPVQTLVVSGTGAVTIVIPSTDTWIGYEVDPWNGVCGKTETLSIPGGDRPHWHHSVSLKTGCDTP